MAKANGDTIFIKYNKNIGIIEWRDILNDKQIYPIDLIFVEINKIYDLKFESGQWHFIILPKANISPDFFKLKTPTLKLFSYFIDKIGSLI